MKPTSTYTYLFYYIIINVMFASCTNDDLKPISVNNGSSKEINSELSKELNNKIIKPTDSVIINIVPIDGCPKGYIWDPIAKNCVKATDPPIDLQTWRSILSNDLNLRFNSTDRYLAKLTAYNLYYYNGEANNRDILSSMNMHFKIPNLNVTDMAHTIELLWKPVQIDQKYTYYKTQLYKIFTSRQKSIFLSYVDQVKNATSLSSINNIHNNIKNQINQNSYLTKNEKIELLGIIEAGHQFCIKYFSGSWTYINSDIQNTLGSYSSSRVAGCSVEWRSVWIGGVVGGVAGGIRGAVIGAAGGTVTLPGAGTVGGAIGGAVFGFTGGFIGGSLSSIAGNLIATCFRKEERTQPTILCEDLKYAINNMRECYPELIDIKFNYYLSR